VRVTGAGRDASRLGIVSFPRSLTGGAGLVGRRHRFGGLALEGLLDQLLRDGLADLGSAFFDIGERGSPLGSLGTVKPIDQVFPDALDIRLHFGQFRRNWFDRCHPWLLSRLAIARTE